MIFLKHFKFPFLQNDIRLVYTPIAKKIADQDGVDARSRDRSDGKHSKITWFMDLSWSRNEDNDYQCILMCERFLIRWYIT